MNNVPFISNTHPLMGKVIDARDFCDYRCYQFLDSIIDHLEYVVSTDQDLINLEAEDLIHIKEVIKKRKELTDVFLHMASGRPCPDGFNERVQILLDNKV